MKNTELMVGDWVCYDGDTVYTCPVKIEGMDISCDFCVTSDRDDTGFNGVTPIPLTAEILEKNGFILRTKDESYGVYRYDWTPFEITYTDDDEGFQWWIEMCGHDYTIHYVHELQHALRLCGLEELADNFKI